MSRSGSGRRQRDPLARQFIYTLTGSAGVYVGCTHDVAHRWATHRTAAKDAAYHRMFHPLYVAMATEGVDAYRFEVVACARDLPNGLLLEHQLMVQLRKSGVRILNKTQRAPSACMRARAEGRVLIHAAHCGLCAGLLAPTAELQPAVLHGQ